MNCSVSQSLRQLLPSALLASLCLAFVFPFPAPAQESSDGLFPDEPDAGAALASSEDARRELRRDVLAYERAISALEARNGAFSPGLSEQLLGLGLALQRNGDHPAAIEAFKRGVHLSRITEGLYSPRQLALLQAEIESHVQMGDLEVADERQRYLYRVQVRTLSDRPRGEALMEHAFWQRQAFEAELGEIPGERLLRMWSLHRLALTEILQAEGESSQALLPPLYGMLRAQYLLSGFVGETSSGQFRTRLSSELENQQLAMSSQSYKQGAAVIQAIYDILAAQPGSRLEDTAQSKLMLGDWQLWHRKRDEAFATYGELYRELTEADGAQELRAAFFDQPQALPSLDGVRAFPEPASNPEGALLLEFGVNDRGRVIELTRLDDNAALNDRADDIMRRLRQTPFRPRFSDGLPVDTDRVVIAYDTDNWSVDGW